MPVQEEVLIVLRAKDEVSKTIESIRKSIESLGKSFTGSMPNPEEFGRGFGRGLGDLDSQIEKTSYRMSGFSDVTSNTGVEATKTWSSMADRMDAFHVGLNRVTNAMTGLFGTMGLFGMAHESWMFATQRQTNQIYLGMRRGTDEAKNMYNEIQNIVMQLPGDDTFLTTILTQASGRDMNMSIENVRTLGDAIADYYVGATAKGQLSYETQRELTSYILTGETRMFTNSILADEIDLLKNKNTVIERATALQEALNKTGFEGMAHYESATNAMEEFKGHFQKAFADLGTLALPVIQGVLGIYNALDSLAGNGGISAGLISLATGIALVTTALGTIGFVTPMVNEGIRSVHLFADGIGSIRNRISEIGSYLGFFREHISSISRETQESIAPLRNSILEASKITSTATYGVGGKTVNFTEYELENGAILTNTQLLQQNLFATVRLNQEKLALKITQSGLTYEQYLENVGLDANTTILLKNLSVRMQKTEAELLDLAMESDLTTAEFLQTLELNLNTIANEENTISKQLNADATLYETGMVNGGIYATIRSTAVNTYHTIVKFGSAIASYFKGDATQWEELVQNSAILTDLRAIYTKITESGANLWNAFTVVTVADAKIVENTVEENSIITKLWNIATTITESEVNTWEAISEFFSGEGKLFNGLSSLFSGDAKILDTLATIGLSTATWLLNGGLVVLEILLSPIGLTILGIVGAVLLLIYAFEQLGKAFGWWENIGGMFEAIQSGLGRIWDAFMNSEPVQAIITTFQNFFYTMESFFGSIMGVLGGIFEVFFGVNDEAEGTFDIVGAIINVLNQLLNVIWNFTPFGLFLQSILGIFNAIGSAIGWVMDTWNTFVDSAEMQTLIQEFQEIREAFGEAFGEIFDALNEVWTAITSIFSGGEASDGMEETGEGGNVLLDVLKAIASIISTVVVPIVRTFADVIKSIATPIRMVAGFINWIGSLLTGTSQTTKDVSDTVNETVSPINALASAIGGLFEWVMGIVSPIMDFLESTGALRFGIYGLITVINPLVGILITVIDLGNQFGVFEWIGGVFNNLSNAIGGVVSWLGQLISSLFDGASGVDWLGLAFNTLMTAISPLIFVGRTIIDIFTQLWNAIGGLGGIINGISSAFNGLMGFLKPVSDTIGFIVEKLQWLSDTFGWVGDTVNQVLGLDSNVSTTTNVNYGAESSMGMLNQLGISPEDAQNAISGFKGAMVDSTNEYMNRPIKNGTSNDTVTQYLTNAPVDSEVMGYLTQPVDYSKTPQMTEPYKTVKNDNQQIVQNIFNEGSVQADARNMSAKDVQNLFTGAFGFNKARGTKGVLN